MTQKTVADLFCGSGGLSLGFKMAGYKIVFGLDVEWNAINTYKKNNPEVKWLNKEIRKVSTKEIMDDLNIGKGDLDVIMGGVPCEGYSHLNRRYNPLDPRNFLFLEFMRIAKELKPKSILIENVPGLSHRNNGEFKDSIIKAIEKLNYKTSYFTLSSLNFGVPQKRIRLFFVGTLDKRFIPPNPTYGEIKNKKNQKTLGQFFSNSSNSNDLKQSLTVRDAISDLPPLKPGEEKNKIEYEPKTEYQKLLRNGSIQLYNHKAPSHPDWTIELIDKTKPGDPLYGTFKQRIRLSWDNPSPTIPSGGVRPQWFFAHPEQPRGLTVREMARLQSFPDNYIFYGSIINQRILVGDSVPPLLAKALGNKLLNFID